MILADTSVWIRHFRSGDETLSALLRAGRVYVHDFVIGELACGNLPSRSQVLRGLVELPRATVASSDEVLAFIELHSLYGRGLGWIDAHLLASASLSRLRLYTLDRTLARAASEAAR